MPVLLSNPSKGSHTITATLETAEGAVRAEAQQDLAGVNRMAIALPVLEPGAYVLEAYSFVFDPANPDLEALAELERTPQVRQEVVVEDGNVALNLVLPAP